MHHTHSEIEHMDHMKKHVRNYMLVFVALMILTVTTVAASYLHFTGQFAFVMSLSVALAIAILKSSLVASIFMHLISEKKMIFIILAMVVVFFFSLMLLPIFSELDPIHIR